MIIQKKGRRDVTVVFDGCFNGFLCVVYAYYYGKISPIIIQRENQAQLTLDQEIYEVVTDNNQATRVLNGMKAKISNIAVNRVYNALLSYEDDKYMAIFNYVLLGFSIGHMVDSHLQEDCVREVHRLAKRVGGEAHLLLGFARFAETESGVLYAVITPKNDVLSLVADHFSRRLMNNAWIIHDKSRNQAAIYDGKSYVIADIPSDVTVKYAAGEKETQELWVKFFNALAIDARKNPKLQRQLLPLYFRKNMTEFNKLL